MGENFKFIKTIKEFVKSSTFYYWILGFILTLGIVLRIYYWGVQDTLEDDQCRLILAFSEKNWLELFSPLGYAQSAPPLLLYVFKLFWNMFYYNEHLLKLLPLSVGIASIFVFYKLCVKFFQHRYSVLIASFLFAINLNLINFTPIFKQYIFDVFICLLCLNFFSDLDIKTLKNKKLIILSIVLVLLPFISLPSVFFIGGFFLLNLINNFKNKEVLYKLTSIIAIFSVIFALYYFFNLAPSKISLDTHFPNYWQDGFWEISNPARVFIIFEKFGFYPNKYTLFTIILSILGIFHSVRKPTALNKLILVSLSLIFLASALKLYPIHLRVSLYAIPLAILLIVKPLDTVYLKSKKFAALCICFFISFSGYNFDYYKNLLNPDNIITYSPKKLMHILKNNYNPKTDIIICNQGSASSFILYSSLLDFKSENSHLLPSYNHKDEIINDYFNNLEAGHRYWFYLVKDFSKKPIISDIINRTKDEKVLLNIKDRKSYLILIER